MKEVAQLNRGKTKIIAVTVLTDKNYRDLAQLDLIQTRSPMVRTSLILRTLPRSKSRVSAATANGSDHR